MPTIQPADPPCYGWDTPEHSIGRIHSWHGNALVLARALAYIEVNGGDGLQARRRAGRAERQLAATTPPRCLRHAVRPPVHARARRCLSRR